MLVYCHKFHASLAPNMLLRDVRMRNKLKRFIELHLEETENV